MKNLDTSDKVLLGLSRRPVHEGKAWLAKHLGISRVTLNKRFEKDAWTDEEVEKIKELGVLR